MHWYDLSEESILYISERTLHSIFNEAIAKAGNIRQLAKSIQLSNPSFYYLRDGITKAVTVRKLKALLKYLDKDLDLYDRE